ncbi:ACP S-malonyltransferase [Roseovarius sp. SCSIO 43702]|uniref:ACP S-malonyltransferase n=1 Tax=Roseovarius sp. SCSIO 43702 TaxID=2823043 RepID=UPI001C73B915|nr:ACP S-malonyltransferase [Roseovarius sp. SCSIO 43702]QYX58605.1 ACP S-malonyltransferase [Roseovarius sp. SCSIO 43702]
MRAVVICPGRGTYNKGELGYLGRHFPEPDLLAQFDARRVERGETPLSDLDGAEKFSLAKHTRGDNASALIYAATLGDFLSIDRDAVEVVAVTGNSMGWYSALGLAGALSPRDGFEVVNTMGALMQEAMIGGQMVYPITGGDWVPDPEKRREIMRLIGDIDARDGCHLTLSIDLGGMLVLAGNHEGLDAFEDAVPQIDGRYPMFLANHAGFHSHLQEPVAERGRAALPASMFMQPDLPLIDGRGAIWWPGASRQEALWDYTLGHQVTETYDFARAVTVAAREFAPDVFIVTGPGTTLGGAVAQSLIAADWKGMKTKDDFKAKQESDPVLVSMGMEDQRGRVTKGETT